MKLTSAQAVKLLRRFNEEYAMLVEEEKSSRVFTAAIQENIEAVRPPYDFASFQEKLDAIDTKIRVIKHAINLFNTTHEVPGFGMTIDEVLVCLPQLTRKKNKLTQMSRRLEKERVDGCYGSSSTNIEYTYANYSVREVREMLAEVSEMQGRLQTALDIVNTQEIMEIDI